MRRRGRRLRPTVPAAARVRSGGPMHAGRIGHERRPALVASLGVPRRFGFGLPCVDRVQEGAPLHGRRGPLRGESDGVVRIVNGVRRARCVRLSSRLVPAGRPDGCRLQGAPRRQGSGAVPNRSLHCQAWNLRRHLQRRLPALGRVSAAGHVPRSTRRVRREPRGVRREPGVPGGRPLRFRRGEVPRTERARLPRLHRLPRPRRLRTTGWRLHRGLGDRL